MKPKRLWELLDELSNAKFLIKYWIAVAEKQKPNSKEEIVALINANLAYDYLYDIRDALLNYNFTY